MLTAKDRKISKKTIKHILVALVLLLLFSGILALFFRTHSFPKATANEIRIGDEIYNLANYKDFSKGVKLGTSDGKLYFYFLNCGNGIITPFGDRVCCFEENGIRKVKKLRDGVLFAGSYFYYNSYTRQPGLHAYSLTDGKDKYWSKNNGSQVPDILLSDNREICIPAYDSSNHDRKELFFNLSNFEDCDNQSHELSYSLGGRKYWIGETRELFQCKAGEISVIPLKFAEGRKIIPVNNGLLVHNYGYRDLLYFIDEAGEITSLFSLEEGMSSESAVNIHGDDVYLSVKRYVGFNDIFLRRYENDAKEGLYRINLQDYSMEKISAHIYDGLYNFDDMYLYATDNNYNIYQLDFDGNIVDVLLKVKDWYEG